MIKLPKQPSQLLQDKEGNWYLVPGPYIVSFEMGLDCVSPTYEAHISKFSRYAVNPDRLMILDWRVL